MTKAADLGRVIVSVIALGASCAQAVEVNVVGLFAGKALLEIDRKPAKLLSVGQSMGGVRLLSADSDSAAIEIDGERRVLRMGQSVAPQPKGKGTRQTTVLTADSRGHFITAGTINGATTRFMVDTGASSVALSSAEAKRLGISYLSGRPSFSQTANGIVPIYLVQLDTVKVGEITLHQVEAAVIEGEGSPVALLGMSFLQRLDMRREGGTLTLIKSY